jgi:hypothetical protein
MKKVVLITEQQRRILIREEVSDKITSTIEDNYNFVKKVLDNTSNQTGLDLMFLSTWGAAIGGMMRPLNDFIMGVDPTLSTDEVCLILSALILTYYHESKSSLKKLMELIKEKNLVDTFKTANDKADELKNTFTKFIESLNISLHKMTNIMAYTFIIPIIPMLVSFSHGNITNEDVTILVKRLVAFGLVALAGNTIKELVSKMIKRFKSS